MPSVALERFRALLSDAALFLDFDGTLSEIVPRPEDARPIPGVGPVLEELAGRCRLVAIVSGRSAEQLVTWLGAGIEIWGVHGAEVAVQGQVRLSDSAAPYVEIVADALSQLEAEIATLDIPGIVLEDKRVVANVHYRMTPDPTAAQAALTPMIRSVAERWGLLVGTGRKTFELKPPAEFSKAEVVNRRAAECGARAAAFIGDDIVDLPAFDALDGLAADGLATLRVAVDSDEASRELLTRADVVVEGPQGVMTFLRALLSKKD